MNVDQSPVFMVMKPDDTYDIVLISMVANWLRILLERNAKQEVRNHFRISRLETMQNLLLEKIEPSYKGSIPEAFINRSEKYMSYIEKDLNSMLKDIRDVDHFKPAKE